VGKIRIELQGISKSYYSETAVTQALRKVNLTFYESEFVAITGESGSGKSTLLNIIGGMDTFDEGEMFVDGEATFQYDDEDWEEYRRKKIGYVFQDYSLVGHYTALDNVMSALLVMGVPQTEAEKTARVYLEQVGLSEYEKHRASELSSGQKQRLSIARALAKNTGIIVADEPTGNLDSETGQQIIQLLSQLSKNRLVIMVTHNYDQAEAYVTRKIRIHDGQVISDVAVNNAVQQNAMQDNPPTDSSLTEKKDINAANDTVSENSADLIEKAAKEKMDRHWEKRIALLFAKRNCQTQRGRAVLFTTFLLVIAIASFLFVGELFQHKDDYTTRNYSQSAFQKEDTTRLVVKRSDGEEMTEEDKDILSSIANVTTVDIYDVANDINFYLEENQDYKFIYGDSSRSRRARESKSGSGNNQQQGSSEVKTLSFINENRFMMSSDCLTEGDLAAGRLPVSQNEIVLYSDDTSVLDTEKTCYFMAKNIWDSGQYYKTDVKIVGILKESTTQVYFSTAMCRMLSSNLDSDVFRLLYNYDASYKDYRSKTKLVPIVNEELNGMEATLSANGEDFPAAGEVSYSTQAYDDDGNPVGDLVQDVLTILPQTNDNTSDFIEVSQDFFDQFYKKQSTQASVYITNYAKTDSVLRKLKKKGYEGISTYRISVIDYNSELVSQRLMIIGISAFGLVMLLLAEVLILRSLMKIRIKDYFVLKFIGMKMQVIRKISYFEMGCYTIFSVLVTLVLMWILRLAGVPIIQEMMWYFNAGAYITYIAYNVLLIFLTVLFFNRLLKGRLNS
jgi:ABC-type lipoprotein export system ATPase subunit